MTRSLDRRVERLERSHDATLPPGMVWGPTLAALLRSLVAEERGEAFDLGEPPGPDWMAWPRETWELLTGRAAADRPAEV